MKLLKKNISVKLLISYGSIVLIPVVIIFITYSVITSFIKAEVIITNEILIIYYEDIRIILIYIISGLIINILLCVYAVFMKLKMKHGPTPAVIKESAEKVSIKVKHNSDIIYRDIELSKKVTEFIAVNYNDPSLSVSGIGAHFNLTPAYLSKLYKDQTGEGLLNCINTIRVEAAKDLLQEGKNVNETALLVGFTNTGTMIRIFKKITGITPGQIKYL